MAILLDGTAGINTSSSLTTGTGAIYNGIQSSTAVASTSGTSIDFTSIPSWVKRITVIFNGVSTTGVSAFMIQIGSGSITSTGYTSAGSNVAVGSSSSAFTNGFALQDSTISGNTHSGQAIIMTSGSNNWTNLSILSGSGGTNYLGAGGVSLSGTLDRVRITTAGGANTFDAGSINILYE